jgi:diaminohydroxyphosphoribosylaminopyrimidine deaminase/5-amino-6-(5-phosphoribosylamino)uracil reductase
MLSEDEKYIKRCNELALQGLGNTSPNPLVGSVIVYDNKIIGEGYHKEYGKSHAEVNAIESVRDKSLLKKSTLYVNLEPCSHYGNTPPCADRIVKEGIPEVVIGTQDTSSKVSGKGISILKEGKCKVKVGVLEEQCREINRRFFTFFEKKRPYLILKWAQTIDGFIDKKRNADDPIQPNWITNQLSKQLVHKWRTEEAGILVGKNTAVMDNPQLTSREWKGKNPARFLIYEDLNPPVSLKLINDEFPLTIFRESQKTDNTVQKKDRNKEFIDMDFGQEAEEHILDIIRDKKINSLIIEGGRQTLQKFIDKNLWDEARVFIGKKIFREGIKAPEINSKKLLNMEDLKETRLYFFRKI